MRSFSKAYLALLKNKFSSLNLTRILDEEEFYHKQILDSTLPFENFISLENYLLENQYHLDIGFGGGFPLLPLAKKYPQIDFLGFEARGKKAKAVQEIADDLALRNVKTYHRRVENILIDLPCTISFKAVSRVDKCLANLKAVVPVKVIFYKGPDFEHNEELELKLRPGWKLLEKQRFELPLGEKRIIVVYEYNVPRGTNEIKLAREMCYLSSLVG